MAIEKITDKPVAASAELADHILIVIDGKLRRATVETLADILVEGHIVKINADVTSAVNEATELADRIRTSLDNGEFNGTPGAAGIYIGKDEPTDPHHPVWLYYDPEA